MLATVVPGWSSIFQLRGQLLRDLQPSDHRKRSIIVLVHQAVRYRGAANHACERRQISARDPSSFCQMMKNLFRPVVTGCGKLKPFTAIADWGVIHCNFHEHKQVHQQLSTPPAASSATLARSSCVRREQVDKQNPSDSV